MQPALVLEVWLAQRDTERSHNLFPCDGLVEIPNFNGPLRDQRLNLGSLPDRLAEHLLEGRDVTPLLQDLPPSWFSGRREIPLPNSEDPP